MIVVVVSCRKSKCSVKKCRITHALWLWLWLSRHWNEPEKQKSLDFLWLEFSFVQHHNFFMGNVTFSFLVSTIAWIVMKVGYILHRWMDMKWCDAAAVCVYFVKIQREFNFVFGEQMNTTPQQLILTLIGGLVWKYNMVSASVCDWLWKWTLNVEKLNLFGTKQQ